MSRFIEVRVRKATGPGYMGVARARVMALVPGERFPGYRVVWRRRMVAQIVPVEPGSGLWRVVFAGEAEPYPGEPFAMFGAAVGFAVRRATGQA